MSLPSALGPALSELRIAAGLTRDRLAQELGLLPEEIAAIESGQRVFTRAKFVSDWASLTGADAQAPRLLALWEHATAGSRS